MATTAVEKPKTRADLAQLAGRGPFSFISMLAGVLVGYAAFALLMGATAAISRHNGSKLDLTGNWDTFGTRGGLLLGGLLFVSYLFAGYAAGRMAWRRGWMHGLAVFVGSIVVVGAVALLIRSLTKPKDVEGITDALRSFGIPITRDEWRNVDSVVGIASLGGMLLGSVLGGALGGRWYTKISRRALAAEIDVRERMEASDERLAPIEDRSVESDDRSDGHGDGNGHRAARRGNGRNRAEAHVLQADLDELSKEELYELAQELDVPGRSQMTKEELKDVLQRQRRSLKRQRTLQKQR